MTSRDFCYWLQGLFEVGQPTELTEMQIRKIKSHLDMVFIHEIDPSFPPEEQEALNKAHSSSAKLDNGSVAPKKGTPGRTDELLMRC